MNLMVKGYDTELKRTVIQLAAAEKLARLRESAIDRVRGELQKEKDKAAADKEVLRVKFDELKEKLLTFQSEKKKLKEENAALKREKAELVEKKEAAEADFDAKGKRLRDSRVYEVTQERIRVLNAMIAKANVRFNNIRDHQSRRDEFEKTRNLYGQAMGTKKLLELMKEDGVEVPNAYIDLLASQEALYSGEVSRLEVRPIPESDLSLSPLILPSQFVDENALASLNTYGSNVKVIDPGTIARMQYSEDGELESEATPSTKVTEEVRSPSKVLEKEKLVETQVVISDGSSEEEDDHTEPAEKTDAEKTTDAVPIVSGSSEAVITPVVEHRDDDPAVRKD